MRRAFALLMISTLLFGCGAPKTLTANSDKETAQVEAQNREYCAEVNTLTSLIGNVCAQMEPNQDKFHKDASPLVVDVAGPLPQVEPGGTAELKIRTQPRQD